MFNVPAIGAVLALVGCGTLTGGGQGITPPNLTGLEVTVGSTTAASSILLAELYGAALEARGATVVRVAGLGLREHYIAMMERGEIDVVPELTNALLTHLVAPATPSANGVSEQVAAITAALPASVTVLSPSRAEDQDAIVCRADVARDHDLTNLSTLRRAVKDLVVGGPAEFQAGSALGEGLSDQLGTFEPLPNAGAIVDALRAGSIDCGVLRSTTAAGPSSGLVTLEDDTLIVPNEAVIPLIATDQATAEVQVVLDAVSSTLDTMSLATLLAQVRKDGAEPSRVAQAWLAANGLS